MRTTRDLFDLSGRVALITGGAGHIGGAIAATLVEAGAAALRLDLRGHIEIICDLESPSQIRLIPEMVHSFASGLDILINCAAHLSGPGLDVPFAEQTVEDMDRSWAVNLRAPMLLAQACGPMLAASGHGSIINVGSIYGVVGPDLGLYGGTGMGCGAAYAATKAGLVGLTRYLATVLAPSVRVNAIMPGGVARGQDPGFVEGYHARTPLGRMATEEDLKGVTAWLASDASAYVTGAVIPVDGGWTAW